MISSRDMEQNMFEWREVKAHKKVKNAMLLVDWLNMRSNIGSEEGHAPGT